MCAQCESWTHIVYKPKQQCYSLGAKVFGDNHQKLILFKILMLIKGLSLSKNSKGHNSAHIQPIWMNDNPFDFSVKGVWIMYILFQSRVMTRIENELSDCGPVRIFYAIG